MQSKSVVKLVAVLAICSATAASAVRAGKVDVCHIPPGNPANAHTINVSENAVKAHLAHGDTLGACVTSGGSCSDTGGTCSPFPDNCIGGESIPGPFDDCLTPADVCCPQGTGA